MNAPTRIARAAFGGGTWVGSGSTGGWREIDDPFAAFSDGRAPSYLGDELGEVELLAPVEPVTIVGIAQNGPDAPLAVQAWLKAPRTVVPSGTEVALRTDAGRQVAEAEIAIVIGRDAFNVSAEDAASVVLGVTAVNDLSSPDRALEDVRNFEAKGGIGYTPLGPWIETDASLTDLPYQLVFDGEVVASTNAQALPASIAECIAYVTRWIPLGPGDVIMTGAPQTSIEVQAGTTIEVRVGGISLVTPTR